MPSCHRMLIRVWLATSVLAGEGHHREGIDLRAASFPGGLGASEGVIVS
jgi:hypothetical protein